MRALCLLGIAALAVLAGGCREDDHPPPGYLVDGTPAQTSAVSFEDVDVPVLATVVRTASSARAPCFLRSAAEPTIERVGTQGSSVTAMSPATGTARACDAVRPPEWCGRAFGRVGSRGPVDPRLSLTCRSGDGSTVAFAWADAGSQAAYLVVEHDQHAEAYAVDPRMPTRITTTRVDLTASTARFDVSEHARSGRRIASYTLEARVGG